MAAAGALAHRGLAWLFILLASCGWVLMLSGVASLQQACSGGMVTTLSQLQNLAGRRRLLQNPTSPGGIPGTVGYLAPVGCDKFFSYAWWITFFDMTVLIILALGVTTLIGRYRGALVAVSAVLLVLLMDTANTFLYFNHINGITSTVAARARVLVAGSIISAIAYFLIIGVVGWHDEDAGVVAPYDAEAVGEKPRKQPFTGLFSGLFRHRKKEEPEAGAGTAGSPRMVNLPPTPIAPQPAAVSPPRAAPMQTVAGSATYTTTTTVPVTTTTAVPISTQAGAMPASPARL